METSARNQLRGGVTSVHLGAVMAEVVVDIGEAQVVAAITKGSAERLGWGKASTSPRSSRRPMS
jgi:molybdopterin-binding protein